MAACSVCARDDVAQVNAALAAGSSARTIAGQFGLGKSSVSRHAEHAGVPRHEKTAPVRAAQKQGQAGKVKRRNTRDSAARPANPARARATVSEPDTGKPLDPAEPIDFPAGRELRVAVCMDLMIRRRWVTGVTGRLIAEASGVSHHTVDDIASEASRRVKSAIDPAYVAARVAATFDEAMDLGIEMVRGFEVLDKFGRPTKVQDPKALSGLAAVGKAYVELAGAGAPKRVDVTSAGRALMMPGTQKPLMECTDEELEALTREERPPPN